MQELVERLEQKLRQYRRQMEDAEERGGYCFHSLINYIDTKAKCRHLKELICKGTFRQVFIRVYRLEKQSIMLVFSTQLCELLPLLPSLWLAIPPSLCV
jgi:hypothetical protein